MVRGGALRAARARSLEISLPPPRILPPPSRAGIPAEELGFAPATSAQLLAASHAGAVDAAQARQERLAAASASPADAAALSSSSAAAAAAGGGGGRSGRGGGGLAVVADLLERGGAASGANVPGLGRTGSSVAPR